MLCQSGIGNAKKGHSSSLGSVGSHTGFARLGADRADRASDSTAMSSSSPQSHMASRAVTGQSVGLAASLDGGCGTDDCRLSLLEKGGGGGGSDGPLSLLGGRDMHNSDDDTVGPLITRSNSDGSCDDGVTLLGSAADDDRDGSASKQLGHRRTNSGLGDVLKGLFSPLSGLSIRCAFSQSPPYPITL